MIRRVLMAIAIVGVLSASSAWAGPYTITLSGPNSAFASDRLSMPYPAALPVLSANITTGKSQRVLVVTVTLADNDFSGPGQLYSLRPEVNGQELILGGGGDQFVTTASPTGTLLTSGTWWLDLDAAGLANVPLGIVVYGSAYYSSSRTTGVSFTAYTLQK